MFAPMLVLEVVSQFLGAWLLWSLYRRDQDPPLRFWAIAYTLNGVVSAAVCHQLVWAEIPALTALEGLLSLVSSACLITGALRSLGRSPGRAMLLAPLAVLAWVVLATALELSFFARTMPVLGVAGLGMMGTGVAMARTVGRGAGARITGVGLVLLGLHIMDYPLAVEHPEFLPWGHAVAALLQFLTFTGIVLLSVERASAKLVTQEARYRGLFDDAAVGIFVADATGTLVTVNSTLNRLIGSSTPLEGQPVSSLYVHAPEAASLLYGTAEPLASHAVRWKAADGRELSVQLYARRLPQGAVEGVVVDITQLEHLRQHLDQAQRAELLGQLAAGIAHDINNVLGVVLASGELLRRTGADPAKREELVTSLLAAGTQGAELTRQLLGFSRQRQGQKTPFELGERVQQVAGMLKPSLGSGINLVLEAPPQGCRIEADPTLIEQLVVNLVLNARDAIPENGRIAISVSPEQAAGAHRVKLEVADNGVGMSPDTLKKAFEPFFTTKSHGTGLGLAVVKRAVSQSAGELNVISEPGRGTTFQVRFPMTSANA
ncbi:MAG: PAS domain S-box protein [Myxococcaceae bacterium]|nr:PAS domain S-box protein [Myxococcaceae bacterium]